MDVFNANTNSHLTMQLYIADFAPGALFVASVYDDRVKQSGASGEYVGNLLARRPC